MIVERIGSRRVLGSSLTGLAIVLSSSVVLAQQPAPQPGAQQPQQQEPGRQPAEQPPQPGQQPGAANQQSRGIAPQQGDVEIARAEPPAQQQAQPMLMGVRVLEVKPDQVGEFEGLIKELRAAIQESARPGFTAWSVEVGDMNTYHLVTELDSFASLAEMEQPPMEPVEWANWLNRIGGTIDSHTVIIGRLRPELSIIPTEQGVPTEQAQQSGELLMLISDTVMAGKTREYEAFVRDELLPALKQADIDAVYTTELMFGTEGRTWVYAVPLPGWQVFDGPSPLVEALGEEGAQQLMLRGDALVDHSETQMLRMRADLSVQPGP